MRQLLLALALSGLPASAQERVARIDTPLGPLAATLSPVAQAPAPAVLLLHGFTGTRDEMTVAGTAEGVFARTARLLAAEGIASLRIDFRGSGDSPGSFAATTFEGQTADALAALDWLAAQPGIDPSRVAVLGWSQGGLVATAVAGRSGRPAALVLWNAVADPVRTFSLILGDDAVARGLAAPAGTTITANGIPLDAAFFHGLTTFSPTREIAAYPGPLLVIQGSRDSVVPPGSAQMLIAAHRGEHVEWTEAMDHAFNAGSGPATLDLVIAATTGFLRRALPLP